MKTKKVNWTIIFKATILMTITMSIYGYFTNQFSMTSIISSALIFPILGVILSFSKSKKIQLQKGCLTDKTDKMKHDFFENLYNFKDTDPIFFLEQSNDLLKDELEQFTTWIFKTKYKEVGLKPKRVKMINSENSIEIFAQFLKNNGYNGHWHIHNGYVTHNFETGFDILENKKISLYWNGTQAGFAHTYKHPKIGETVVITKESPDLNYQEDFIIYIFKVENIGSLIGEMHLSKVEEKEVKIINSEYKIKTL